MVLKRIFKKVRVEDMLLNEEKINEVNNLLKQGYSLNKLDKENKLGCSRRAFCNNAKKIGFEFSKKDNKFIILENRVSEEIIIKDTIPKENVSELKSEHEEADNSVTIEQLDNRLKKLEELMLQGVTDVTQQQLNIDKSILEGKIQARTFKVDDEVLKEFDKLCKNELAAFSKSNVISQALKEFIDKYKI